ncbi:BTE_HP_G0179950.mRNA.1.CDS.1 [Saccharomyces cerevisiae]|nr:BTE_HP_G0221800.mRNA.1.CDS.1 [Saccharomyces cerevisiae]CAI5059899.1 BTE_HP_G0096320.mRNA.1.CDS.1 [Saccharomyces cerevisiae]CAI5215223.1 BTE_HP_G0179950.mRNA.1.CDS.1 [Saccharomyces cerevisiae]CAI6434922.1 BTE_HP_G0221800.mRNA.1.CDS.1 [Saccharomyces cerevisiae]CAI6960013.1 BTE_HP_G0096320.mRNA.1.CDS.1 [Saccharomyces cerevisiae]
MKIYYILVFEHRSVAIKLIIVVIVLLQFFLARSRQIDRTWAHTNRKERFREMTAIGNTDDALDTSTAASKENGKGRLRVQKACELCKKRKVKCDGNNPCLNCSKQQKECRYDFKATNRKRRRRQVASAVRDVSKTYAETSESFPRDLLSKSNIIINAPSDGVSSSASNSPNPNSHYHNISSTLPFMSGRPNHTFHSGSNLNGENNNNSFPEDHMAKLLLQLSSKLGNTTKESSIRTTRTNASDVNANPTVVNMKNSQEDCDTNHRSAICDSAEALHNNNINSKENKIINSQITNTVNDHFESPWQTFSLDKYRFHRRYQNILPYYLGVSILKDLSPQTIEYAKLKRPRVQNYGWNLSGGHYLKYKGDFRSQEKNIRHESKFFDFDDPVHLSLINKLLRYYFDEINPVFSIIHEATFWQQYNNKFLRQGKQNNSSANLFTSMLYLILSTTLRFREGHLDGQKGQGTYSNTSLNITFEEKSILIKKPSIEENLFKYAYLIINTLTFEWESFELIQSWLLITFYFRTCYRQTACWNALSQAVNMCNGMSLYLNKFPEIHSTYDESKAWHCFWCCFIMDKLISFQMGRFYQLSLPASEMCEQMNLVKSKKFLQEEDDWFHEETFQMLDLSIIVTQFLKRDAQDLNLNETVQLRSQLGQWYDTFIVGSQTNAYDDNYRYFYQVQPFMTYLDIRLTFEVRQLFCLIAPSSTANNKSLEYVVDTELLISHCQMAIENLAEITRSNLFFVPWWLNLSQLFTVNLICIIYLHAGIAVTQNKAIMQSCQEIWRTLECSKPKNRPSMLPECLWCLKMLNHMFCIRLRDSALQLEATLGTDHGDDTPNRNKFEQFKKVGDNDADVEVDAGEREENADERQENPRNNSKRVPLATRSHNTTNFDGSIAISPESAVANLGTDTGLPSDVLDTVSKIGNSPNVFDDDLFSNLLWFDQNFA